MRESPIDLRNEFSLIMMNEGFIAGSANIENLDEGAEPFPIVRENVSPFLQVIFSISEVSKFTELAILLF